MALDQGDLASTLEDAFDAQGTAAASANALAKAYSAYAESGAFGLSLPTITGEAALAATILAAIATPASGSPAAFGGAWSSGLVTFWTGVAVAGGSGAGATAGCPGAAVAGTAITAAVGNIANTSATAAASIAAALHTATLTVTAALTIPPNPPVVFPIA